LLRQKVAIKQAIIATDKTITADIAQNGIVAIQLQEQQSSSIPSKK
jgi:hypothetical protein